MFAQGNAQNGKQLFEKMGCFTCHGHLGQGGGAGAKLAPKPISLTAFMAYLRKPNGVMPPYTAKQATDGQLADIHAYLSSITAPDPKNVPLLNQ